MRYRLPEIWAAWERQHQRRLSYRQLAKETKVSVSNIQRIMEGKNAEIQTLQKLCDFFGVSLNDMIDDSGETV